MKISQKMKFWQTLKIVTIIYGHPVFGNIGKPSISFLVVGIKIYNNNA